MNEQAEALEALVAERLSIAAPDAQVILFGSRARGEAGEASDVDILVSSQRCPVLGRSSSVCERYFAA